MIDVLQLTNSYINDGIRLGYEVVQYGEAQGYPLVALIRNAAPEAPCVYLSSGVHGDEPAAPLALHKILLANAFPENASVVICPLINPSGLDLGTRGNFQGIDLNRDFRASSTVEVRSLIRLIDQCPPFEVSLCLHEDWESTGFYLYALGGRPAEDLGIRIRDHVAKRAPIDPESLIDGHAASNGLILPASDLNPADHEDWPEAFYLYQRQSHCHFTFESPSSLPLATRIEMHERATSMVLANIPFLDACP